MTSKVIIGNCVLYNNDCRDVLPQLEKKHVIISDPPYEEVMQSKFGRVAEIAKGAGFSSKRLGNRIKEGRALPFNSVDSIREQVTPLLVNACSGWLIVFCMAEGVRAWRDEIEKTEAKYKRAMVWIKPDAMPQFNG